MGSTWLWSKFRENPKCYCYYEIFNEILEEIDFNTISHSSSDWNSGHPSGPPYFSEFSPLLTEDKGVIGFDRDMAFADFFLQRNGDGAKLKKHKAYLSSLVDIGRRNERIPVLSCTRSIGRIDIIKDMIGGTHILIKRNILHQWFSYLNQAFYDNLYFIESTIKTIENCHNYDIMKILKKIIRDNDINSCSDIYKKNDLILVSFLSLQLFMYAISRDKFDIEIIFDEKTTESQLIDVSDTIRHLTSLEVDLSDYRERISAPIRLIDDIDRVVFMVRSIFAKGVPGVDSAWLHMFVDRELFGFRDEYERYVAIAGSAHSQLARCQAKQEARSAELVALHQSAAEQIGALQAQVIEISDKFEAERRERAQAQSELNEKDQCINALTRASEASQAVEAAAQQALRQALEKERQIQAQLAESVERLESEKQAAQQERARAQSELDEKDQRICALTQASDASRQSLDALRQQLAASQAGEAAARQTVQQALEKERQIQTQLAEAVKNLELEKHVVKQERLRAETAVAQMTYVLSGDAAEDDAFNRRWAAMIGRLG